MAQKVEYIVDVSKTGSGGAEAATELQKANAAAVAVNKSTGATEVSFAQLNQTTKTTTTSLKALSGVAILIGGSQFPQLASGAYVVKAGMDAVRLSGVTLTAGLATTAAGIAGLVAALTSAVFWYRAFQAQQQEAATGKALQEQTKNFTNELREQIRGLQQAGEITEKTFTHLSRSLNAGQLQEVRDFLKEQETGTAASRIADFERKQALNTAIASAAGNVKVAEEEVNALYFRRLQLYNELKTEGLMTAKEAAAAADEAAIKEAQRHVTIQKNLTQVQVLERSLAETSAAGLASMVVNFKNAQQAAADLLRTLAQMIVQFLIMQAFRAAMPGLFPVAAMGGQFPRFMANGGYSEVNGATYFPKFNVVAGEAGREVMTVMARPRLMEIGGMTAQVGDVGPNRMALTNANDLQRSFGMGAAGRLHITIEHSEMSRIGIINDAVGVSLDTVTRKMGERGPLSERTRRLVNQ